MFKHWATPVIHPVWAIASTLLYRLMRLSGYRLLGPATHTAWRRATWN